MTIDVQWYDNETIRTTFTPQWTWDEFTAALDMYHVLAANMMRDNYHVVDLRACHRPAAGDLSAIPADLREPEATTAMTVIIGGDEFRKTALRVFSSSGQGHQLVTVDTLDDAEALIQRHRQMMHETAS